ncbi:MAG: TlpA disulfide reductase family protein [Burkholderiales bacterium]
MGKFRDALALLVAVSLGAGAIYLGLNWDQSSQQDTVADPLSAGALYTTSFPDLNGNTQALGQWQGKIIVLNLWATWCAPCREEIPVLIKLQRKYAQHGVIFVGLALDDNEPVAKYSKEMGIDYPILVAGSAANEFARRLGNRNGLLPFTVIIDRSGKTVTGHLGGLDETRLEKMLQPLI